ncbi:MAG: terminase family protein [Clostridia bacterium]|nr:terminase family protein [Clostridia bacterium]
MGDELKRILLIEREQARRKNFDRLSRYNSGKKVHKKQIAFHKCKKKNRWVFGGNRSGKTECGAVEVVYMARGIHPYRKNRESVSGWVVSLSSQVQRDVAQKKILSYLNPDWIQDVVMREGRRDNLENGVIDLIIVKNVFGKTSTIGFKSCDQGREKFQGASLDFVWFDEEPPKDVYDECKMRVLDRSGDIFGTMTPLKGMTFIYEEIYMNKYGSKEVWYEFMEWADNPYLDKKEVKKLNDSMSDETLEARRYGRFSVASGLVYKEFDENVHVIEPFPVPTEWQADISIDPGLNNPLACHFYAVDYDGNVYVVAEHFEAGRELSYHAEMIKAIAKRLKWKTDSFGRLHSLIDSAANQRTLSGVKSVTELFFEQGIAVDPRVNKDLFTGIARVKEYLKSRKLFIFSSCVNLIREIKGYFWKNQDAPVKKDDHCLDELRYFICSRPENKPPERQKTVIELDKERLIRKLKRRRK